VACHLKDREFPMKLAVPDLISSSYFPAVAAVELGLFEQQGLDIALELMVPIEEAFGEMHAGTVDFLGCSAHVVAGGFPEWRGARLLCAQSQGMYWFLVMRRDLGARRGELDVLKGRRIGAAPWVGQALVRLLAEAGYDPKRDGITIEPIPDAREEGTNFGVAAAQALADGKVDGFWANGMGAELAVRSGAGTVVLDVRRGDGPNGCIDYTFPALATTELLIRETPAAAAAAVRAIVETHKALKADVNLALEVGRRLFPPSEAELIVDLVRRDLPWYDATLSRDSIARMTAFSRAVGILRGQPSYENVVAVEFAPLWAA
jgi:ABC-type nitrate/sulfonate/bicarbonate transport system substrate-binding protein